MRISFVVAAADLSGGARVIHTYASLLSKRGHDVHVIARPPAPRSVRHRVKAALGMGSCPGASRRQATHCDGSTYDFRLIDEFRPIRSDDVPDSDVVIATWWETAEWIWQMPESKGRKAHFVQGYEVFEYTDANRVKNALKLPVAKITVSEWLRNILVDDLGNNHVSLIYNSVDTKLFNAELRSLNVNPTVGLLFSSIALKNCNAGLEALKLLKQKIPNARIVVIGLVMAAGKANTARAQTFSELDQNELREVYSSCDVWLWPSRSEGFGWNSKG